MDSNYQGSMPDHLYPSHEPVMGASVWLVGVKVSRVMLGTLCVVCCGVPFKACLSPSGMQTYPAAGAHELWRRGIGRNDFALVGGAGASTVWAIRVA